MSPTSAWILHSPPYFFITLFPTVFFLRSRMTGRYLILLYKTHSGISTHTYFRSFMFTHTCPFRRLTPPLSPTSGDGFFIRFISIFFWFCSYLFFYSYVSAHTCPFRQPVGWHFPRQAGTAYISCTFLLRRKVIYHLSKNAILSCRHSWAAGRTGIMTEEKT